MCCKNFFYSMETKEKVTAVAVNELPKELQIKISLAMEDYQQGRYITNEQLKQKMQQWRSG